MNKDNPNIKSNTNTNRFTVLKQPTESNGFKPSNTKTERKEQKEPFSSRFDSMLADKKEQEKAKKPEEKKPQQEEKTSRFDSLLIASHGNQDGGGFIERKDYKKDYNNNNKHKQQNTEQTNNHAIQENKFRGNQEAKLEITNASLFPSLYCEVEQYDNLLSIMYPKQMTLDYSKIKESIQQEEYLETVVTHQYREYGNKTKQTNSEKKAFAALWNMHQTINEKNQQAELSKPNIWEDWYDNKKAVMEYLTKQPYEPDMEGYCEECDKYEAGEYDNQGDEDDVLDETTFNESDYISKKKFSEM